MNNSLENKKKLPGKRIFVFLFFQEILFCQEKNVTYTHIEFDWDSDYRNRNSCLFTENEIKEKSPPIVDPLHHT